MTIFLPNMGITSPSRALKMIRAIPDRFVGAFVIPGGYGFAPYNPPMSWTDSVLKYDDDPQTPDESTADVLDLVRNTVGQHDHDSKDGMYLMIWVGIMSNPATPTQLDYVIQHVRTSELAQVF